jgi:thioredoxin 1
MYHLSQKFFAFLMLLALSTSAMALEKEKFTMERFEALQKEGAVIMVDIFASWCPTCARQQEVIADYRAKNPDNVFHILEVDFDSQKEWVRHFRAPRQSTILVYAGEEQFWYSVAETRPEVIAAELDKAIQASR